MLVLATLGLVVLAAMVVPWDWVPGGELRPVPASDVFTPQQMARAEDYARTVRLLALTSYAVSVLLAVSLGLTRAGSAIGNRLTGRLRWWVAVPLLTLVLLLAGRLATLPLGLLIRARNLEEGLTTQALGGWLVDRLLSLLVSWLVVGLLLLLVVGAARRDPRRWFLWAGTAVAAATFALSLAYPLVVEPLFNDFEPLDDPGLERSVLALARSEGVDVDEVLVADASRRTTTLNAYVSGLGGTRRVVIYDTLLADASPREVRSVIAHELAHARHHDVVIGTGLAALGGVVGVAALALLLDSARLRRRAGVAGPDEARAVPLVLALVAVGGLLATPLQSTVSRAIEARADRTAITASGDVRAFEDVQRRLALRSLADPTPPELHRLWFGTHPTVLERLGLAAAVADGDR